MKCEAMFYCPVHREYFDVLTDEIPSWECPRCKANRIKNQTQGDIKPLDKAIKEITAQAEKRRKDDNN